MKKIIYVIAVLLCLPLIRGFGQSWNYMGPNTVSCYSDFFGIGRANRVYVHPILNPSGVYEYNYILAATMGGGLYKSENGGDTWVNITENYPIAHVTSIAVIPDQTDPNNFSKFKIIISTEIQGLRDADDAQNFSCDDFYTCLFRSSDGGLSWTKQYVTCTDSYGGPTNISFFLGSNNYLQNVGRVQNIKMIPASNGNVLIMVCQRAILKSVDNGITWKRVWVDSNGNITNGLYDIDVMLYGAIIVCGDLVLNSIPIGGQTTDKIGESWTNITSTITGGQAILNRSNFAVLPNTTTGYIIYSYSYVDVEDENANGKIDDIITISELRLCNFNTNSFTIVNNTTITNSYEGGNFEISPSNNNLIYMGLVSLCAYEINPISGHINRRGLDNGTCDSYLHVDHRNIVLFNGGSNIDILYSANDGGLSRGEIDQTQFLTNWIYQFSNNYLNTINTTQGMYIQNIYGMSSCEQEPDLLSLATLDNHAFLYDNNTVSNYYTTHGDEWNTIIDPDYPDNIYVFRGNGGSKENATNGGISRTNRGSNPTNIVNYPEFVDINVAFHPTNSNIMFMHSQKYFLKINNVRTKNSKPVAGPAHNYEKEWQDDPDVDFISPSVANISCFAISKSNPQIIYLATKWRWGQDLIPGQLFKSINGGVSFTNISTNFGNLGTIGPKYINSITIQEGNENVLYVALDNANKNGNNSQSVWISINGGTSFSGLYTNIPYFEELGRASSFNINQLLYNSTNAMLYAGTKTNGVWACDPHNSYGWYNISSCEIKNKSVKVLNIVNSVKKLRAGVFGRGPWETDLPAVCTNVNTLSLGTQQQTQYSYSANSYITSSQTISSTCYYKVRTNGYIKMQIGFKVPVGKSFRAVRGPSCADYSQICNPLKSAVFQISETDTVSMHKDSIKNELVYTTNAIETKINNDLYSVYPSIFNESINIDINSDILENTQIEIFDMNGRLISKNLQPASTNTIQLNVSPGMYIIKISVEGKIYTEKVYKSGPLNDPEPPKRFKKM